MTFWEFLVMHTITAALGFVAGAAWHENRAWNKTRAKNFEKRMEEQNAEHKG